MWAPGLEICEEFGAKLIGNKNIFPFNSNEEWNYSLDAKYNTNNFVTALQLLNHHGKWQISPSHLVFLLNSLLARSSTGPKSI